MIKIAVVGTSSIAENMIQAMQATKLYEVIAIYSRTYQKGKMIAEKYQIPKVYDRYQELLKDEEIEFVYIASPNSVHFTQAYEALENSKNVIIEKPMVTSETEFLKLQEIAIKMDKQFFEAVTILHHPNYQVIKKHLALLGEIRMIQMNMSQYSSKYPAFKKGELPNVFNPTFAGGALMDINVYNIHFLLGLFPNYLEVFYTPVIQQNIDTSGVLTITYENSVASLVGSKDSDGKNFVLIQGENGYLYVDGTPSLVGEVNVVYRKEKALTLALKQERNVYAYELENIANIYLSNDTDTYNALVQHCHRVICVLDKAIKQKNA